MKVQEQEQEQVQGQQQRPMPSFFPFGCAQGQNDGLGWDYGVGRNDGVGEAMVWVADGSDGEGWVGSVWVGWGWD